MTSQRTAPLSSDEPIVYRMISSTGKELWLEQRYTVITTNPNPVAVEGMTQDRTEQVQGHAALQRSLHEKELLLKEIHHRVKNNLTLVGSSPLTAAKSEDEQLREMLAISRKRLLSVARIHDTLYQSDDFGQIDLKAYVTRLGAEFAEALGSNCTSIRFDLEEVTVAMSHAVQFGLILNGIRCSNAFKHAFPVEYQAVPSIEIRCDSSAGIETTVRDNGIGLPPDFSLLDALKSLGLPDRLHAY